MSAFTPLGQSSLDAENENAFWPSFTDIMMVVVLIFLMATSLLIVRNWNLVAELQSSIEAERQAAQLIESTSMENATLEERLANAEQLNSILRLQLLDKEEQLKKATLLDVQRRQSIDQLQSEKQQASQQIELKTGQLQDAENLINDLNNQIQQINNQLAQLQQQLQQQIQLTDAARAELEMANAEIAILSASTAAQQKSIELLEQEKIDYNRELLTLKGEYEVVKSKYEELVKPARSAKGKYIAEVFYVKQKEQHIIRFKLPGEAEYTDLTRAQLEQRLGKLKQEKGQDLYVKIIIPKDSGLTYNEAWGFMSELLDKYDYYYQDSNKNPDSDQKNLQ